VKELKVDVAAALVGAREEKWNPVKELKVVHKVGERHEVLVPVESGEGIESSRLFVLISSALNYRGIR